VGPHCTTCGTLDSMRDSPAHETAVMGVVVSGHGARCWRCNHVAYSADEVVRQEREAAGKLVRDGVRNGRELWLLRDVAGLAIEELAGMLEVSAETLARWEAACEPPPESAAAILIAYCAVLDLPSAQELKLVANR
jgi:DNA-binding transcriptional regulator YiaG